MAFSYSKSLKLLLTELGDFFILFFAFCVLREVLSVILFSETACGLGPYCQGEAESERSGFWELKKGVYFANN